MTRCTCHSHGGFLTELGIERRDAAQGPVLAGAEAELYLDRVGSVSGLRRDEAHLVLCEEQLEEQYLRHRYGS